MSGGDAKLVVLLLELRAVKLVHIQLAGDPSKPLMKLATMREPWYSTMVVPVQGSTR